MPSLMRYRVVKASPIFQCGRQGKVDLVDDHPQAVNNIFWLFRYLTYIQGKDLEDEAVKASG